LAVTGDAGKTFRFPVVKFVSVTVICPATVPCWMFGSGAAGAVAPLATVKVNFVSPEANRRASGTSLAAISALSPHHTPATPQPSQQQHERDGLRLIEPLGRSFEAPDSLTILEAAGFADLRLPRSCRNGTCRTCICKMTAGQVRYTIEWPGLSREEKQEGYILPCVAIAETDVVIEAPDAVELQSSSLSSPR